MIRSALAPRNYMEEVGCNWNAVASLPNDDVMRCLGTAPDVGSSLICCLDVGMYDIADEEDCNLKLKDQQLSE